MSTFFGLEPETEATGKWGCPPTSVVLKTCVVPLEELEEAPVPDTEAEGPMRRLLLYVTGTCESDTKKMNIETHLQQTRT